jgi:hypothetical protein
MVMTDIERRGRSDDRGDIMYEMRFTQAGRPGESSIPTQLVWDVPIETRQVPIHAEFHDLPLP